MRASTRQRSSNRPSSFVSKKLADLPRSLAHLPELEAFELGRPRLRHRNPIYTGVLEGITQALYDIYAVASNQTTIKLTLFANGQGTTYSQGGVTSFVKTAAHTSQILAGVLEAPKKHIVRAISVFTEGNVVGNDLEKFLECFAQFTVNTKSYQDTIIGRLPAGGGVSASMMGTFSATNGYSLTGNGMPYSRNTYVLAYGGVPIEQQQNFAFIIDPTISNVSASAFSTANAVNAPGTPIAGTGIFAHVFLDGTLFRAVQ